MKSRRLALRLALLTLALGVHALAQHPSPPTPAPPTLDQLRAQKFALLSLDGKRVELNKLLGKGKPVAINFWATWCGPCRQETPLLNELAEKHRQAGLVVIGLTFEDPEADRQKVKDFVREFEVKYQTAFAPAQIYQFFNGPTTAYRIPQTVVFNADGALVKRLIGYNPRIGREVLSGAVEKAVGGGPEKTQE